jgi:radical SAM protein with 4Fe4S-binding SPASM domain
MIKELQIELTNACPASCLMCSHRHMKRPVKHMELGLLRKIIDEAKGILKDPYILGICGIGEPVMHPQFVEAINIIREVPFSVGTNGYLLDEFKQDVCINARFTDFVLSIDAITAATHAKMRPGLDFNVVMLNALSFLSKIRKNKQFWRSIYVQIIPTKDNLSEVDGFVKFWSTQVADIPGAKVFVKPMYQWPGLTNPYYPGPIVVGESTDKLIYGSFEDTTFRSRCNLFDDWAMIQSDGSYQPCCMPVEDEYKVGNVNDATIEQLYTSAPMANYRKLFRDRRYDEIPFCKNCV